MDSSMSYRLPITFEKATEHLMLKDGLHCPICKEWVSVSVGGSHSFFYCDCHELGFYFGCSNEIEDDFGTLYYIKLMYCTYTVRYLNDEYVITNNRGDIIYHLNEFNMSDLITKIENLELLS